VFIEHPIIFLGYSLSDQNVKTILDSIAACLSATRLQQLADRLILVKWDPGASAGQIGHHTITTAGKNLTATHIETNDFLPVLTALESIRRRYPAGILRRLKEDIYELVRTNDPSGRLFVDDIENAPDKNAVEVVFGVGVVTRLADVGILGFKADQLIEGLVFDNLRLPPDKVVSKLLPALLQKAPKVHLPVYVFLDRAGLLDSNRSPVTNRISGAVLRLARSARDRSLPPQDYRKHKSMVDTLGGIDDVVQHYGSVNAAFFIPLLDDDKIDRDKLREYLQSGAMAQLKSGHSLQRTQYRKLAMLLDWLLYGPAKPFQP
jgi:hypothetical protein